MTDRILLAGGGGYVLLAGGGYLLRAEQPAIGRADEADQAFAPVGKVVGSYGLAVESEAALATAAASVASPGLAGELDAGLAAPARQAVAAGVATETDAPLVLAVRQVATPPATASLDTALAPALRQIAPVGRVDEVDSAFPLTGGSNFGVGAETEMAPFPIIRLVTLYGVAVEGDFARALRLNLPPSEKRSANDNRGPRLGATAVTNRTARSVRQAR